MFNIGAISRTLEFPINKTDESGGVDTGMNRALGPDGMELGELRAGDLDTDKRRVSGVDDEAFGVRGMWDPHVVGFGKCTLVIVTQRVSVTDGGAVTGV